VIIAQISDTHLIVDGPGSAQRIADFKSVIADINALDPAPDLIVHTGDIVHNGRTDEYAAAAAILRRARAPVYVMAGNKDDRANLREAFAADGYLADASEFIDYAVDGYPVRLLMLDTVNPGSKKGDFCTRRLARLEALLAQENSKPIAVFTHHPPFEVLVGPERFHFDDLGVMERLAAAILKPGRVAAILSGHVHRSTMGRVGTIPAAIVPSAATGLRYGDYPAHLTARPIYFVHRSCTHGGFSTETHVASGRSIR
jgi:3',5'-cyclic AMP phosphodiesterase CpdA